MGRDLRIAEASEVGSEAWDDFVDASDEAWLWHRYDYVDALAMWPQRSAISFGVMAGDDLEAVVPATIQAARLGRVVPWPIVDSQGGPALRSGITSSARRELLDLVTAELSRRADVAGAAEVVVSLSPLTPAMRAKQPLVNPLLEYGENVAGQTWVVDMPDSEDELWTSLEGRARTAVRKARRTGVTIRRAEQNERDLDIYYELHRTTYERTGVPPHPRSYFERIWERFLARGFSRIYLAEMDGEPIGGQNFAWFKGSAIYWTGAGTKQALDTGANNLLQWHAMTDMLQGGIDRYEVGEAFPGSHGTKSKGLSDFKASFGGELHPLFRTRIDRSSRSQRLVRGLREVFR